MVEPTVKNASNSASGAGAGSASSGPARPKPPLQQAQEIADQALSAGRDLKERVAGLAESSAEAVKSHAADFADAAKDFASQAGETLKERAYDQKNAGAAYVGNIADAMRRAAREFDDDLPIAGVYIRKAASRVEDISDTVQSGDLQDLVRGAQSFARRQPTAFLGLAVLAGFGVVRFLKSSTGRADDVPQPSQRAAGGSKNSGAARTNESGVDNRGYRDEFTK